MSSGPAAHWPGAPDRSPAPAILLPDAIVFRLKLFGSASIEGPDGPLVGRPVQRRRLALLALLAVARQRGLTRDKVIGYLWPDADAERGRPLVSDSIYHVNHAVDGDAIVAIGDELRLDPERLPSDVWEFLEAVEQRDWQRAVELHAAPFLDGFFLPGCEELERWVDAERETLSRARGRALEALADGAEQAGKPADAVRWWRLLAAQDPYSSRVALRLMRALDRSGDAPAALRHAHVHSVMLREEMNVEPDAELLAFVEELRAGPRTAAPPPRGRPSADAGSVSASAPAPVPEPRPTTPPPPADVPAAHAARGPGSAKPPRGRRALLVASVFAVIMVAAFAARLLFRPRAAPLQLGRVLPVTHDPGLELEPALSPDGKFVAYSGPHGALMVRQVDGPEPIRIVARRQRRWQLAGVDARWPEHRLRRAERHRDGGRPRRGAAPPRLGLRLRPWPGRCARRAIVRLRLPRYTVRRAAVRRVAAHRDRGLRSLLPGLVARRPLDRLRLRQCAVHQHHGPGQRGSQ